MREEHSVVGHFSNIDLEQSKLIPCIVVEAGARMPLPLRIDLQPSPDVLDAIIIGFSISKSKHVLFYHCFLSIYIKDALLWKHAHICFFRVDHNIHFTTIGDAISTGENTELLRIIYRQPRYYELRFLGCCS